MTFPKARVIVSGGLFLAWLGFLLYLVLETRTTHVARPQFLIAQAVVVVEVRDDAGTADPSVSIKEVLRGDEKLAGQKLRLSDLFGCKKEHGYSGAGDYVIPLMRRGNGWQIAPVATPGYPRPRPSHGTLEIIDAGKNPELVLERLQEYTREKPREAVDLLEPLMPALAVYRLGQVPFADLFYDWQQALDVPPGIQLRRVPIVDSIELEKSMKKRGAHVRTILEEVRIYPLTPAVRADVDEINAARTK